MDCILSIIDSSKRTARTVHLIMISSCSQLMVDSIKLWKIVAINWTGTHPVEVTSAGVSGLASITYSWLLPS